MNPYLNPEYLQVSFENPDFSPSTINEGSKWLVRSMTWSLPGGADTASLQLIDDRKEFGLLEYPLTALAGLPLKILSSDGTLVWNGWVETAVRIQKGVRSSCSTRLMANCVMARFPEMSDAVDASFARWCTSAWVQDDNSIARFGRKEHLLTLPYMNAQAAESYLIAALSGGNAWPLVRISPAAKDQADGLQIIARGWWQRLDWLLDGQQDGGREMHLEGGKTHLAIGGSLSQSKLAQSWETDQTDFHLGQVWLRCAAVGAPAEALQVSLNADQNGLPGTLLAQAGAAERFIHGGWQWVCWAFNPPVVAQADTPYWLLLKSSGSTDEINYYQVQSDDGRGYIDGSLKRWNGSVWIAVNHDLRFVCMSVSETSHLITEMLLREAAAAFIEGVQVWQESGVAALRWREIGKTCRETVQELLDTSMERGSATSLLINPQRKVEIFRLPRTPYAALQMRPDGTLQEANGEPIGWDTPLLGREVLVDMPFGEYRLPVNHLRWTPQDGLRLVALL
jgi:hypothetical protein